MVYSLAVNHGSPQQAGARKGLLSWDWLHLDTLRNPGPSPLTVAKKEEQPVASSCWSTPEHLHCSHLPSLLPFCGQVVLTTHSFPDISALVLLCLPFSWTLANFPTSFVDSGVQMALQGWVLIEEQLKCSDMFCIYYPTVNLGMFALGLDLWGNERQMKMYLNPHLCLLS